MISAIALVDLDDTLFQTRRKCPAGMDPALLTPFAFLSDGEPISYATPSQMTLIRWLEETTLVVAVTARSTDALQRTRLNYRHAVAAHGGVVLRGAAGRAGPPGLSADWRSRMTQDLTPHLDGLDALVASVQREADQLGIDVRPRIVAEDGLALYVVVKHGPDGNEVDLQRACAGATAGLGEGWTAHVNGNNIAYLPPGLGKAHAVEWLLPLLKAEHPSLPVIGIGDSYTDSDFMRLADFAMTPTRSQLATRLFPGARWPAHA